MKRQQQSEKNVIKIELLFSLLIILNWKKQAFYIAKTLFLYPALSACFGNAYKKHLHEQKKPHNSLSLFIKLTIN